MASRNPVASPMTVDVYSNMDVMFPYRLAGVAMQSTDRFIDIRIEGPLARRKYEKAWTIDESLARIIIAVSGSDFASDVFSEVLYVPDRTNLFLLEGDELYSSTCAIESLGRPVVHMAGRTSQPHDLEVLNGNVVIFDDYSACWLIESKRQFAEILQTIHVKEWIGTYWSNRRPTPTTTALWQMGYGRDTHGAERALLSMASDYQWSFLLSSSHNHAEVHTCHRDVYDDVLRHVSSCSTRCVDS